ncbi:MAG: P-loop NTPase fold protein [Lentisphaerota bacterium]
MTKIQFNPDRPISCIAQDVLGRKEYAINLANAIKGWREKDSLVLGLTGPWGCGKSSIKNMIIEQLRSDNTIKLLEFNPWEWSSQATLNESFFHELGIVFDKKDIKDQSDKLALKWRYYGGLIGMGAFAIDSAINAAVQIPVSRISNFIGDMSEKAAHLHELRADLNTKTLEDIKQEIAAELKDLKNTILVIVDDIDRLFPEEIKSLLQLIKANADFPNIVYLLLLDKEATCQLIEKLMPGKGQDFLKKIIQVELAVPAPNHNDIASVLFKKLNEALEGTKYPLDEDRWGMMVSEVNSFFSNLRDVYRFCSALSFAISSYVKDGTLEINIIDLILLELIRIFEPNVYDTISQHETLLISDSSSAIEKENTRILEGIINLASEANRDTVKAFISDLFPNVQSLLKTGYGYSVSFEDKWQREKRICHEKWFHSYFELSLPEKFIMATEEVKILGTIEKGNYQEMLELFQTYIKSERLDLLIDFLKTVQPEIAEDKIANILGVLFTLGDFVSDESQGVFAISLHQLIGLYSWKLFENKVKVDKRKAIFLEAMGMSSGISVPSIIIRKSIKYKSDGFWEKDDDVSKQKAACVDRIKILLSKEEFWNISRVGTVLVYFGEWADKSVVQKLMADKLTDSNIVIKFLKAMLNKSQIQSSSKPGIQKKYSFNLKSVERLIPVDKLKSLVDKIAKKSLKGLDKEAFDTFYLALKRREEGKPDENWDEDDLDDED